MVDELGAHVSAEGGVQNCPSRATDIGVKCIQLFTKQAQRWNEPTLDKDTISQFLAERESHNLDFVGAHDSYLINLSSPNLSTWEKSKNSFQAELERSTSLQLDFVVTHPGNATGISAKSPENNDRRQGLKDVQVEMGRIQKKIDSTLDDLAKLQLKEEKKLIDKKRRELLELGEGLQGGLELNASGITSALEAVPKGTKVLLELTAGSGTSVGGTFEHLARIREFIPLALKDRVGFCFDTCHGYSAGYDLLDDYNGVWDQFDSILGLENLGLIHMNDSQHPFLSHKDRHQNIGDGFLGMDPFRNIMTDPRLSAVPKILETPKGDDPVMSDMHNLSLLRSLRQ
ncbi:MAG TPA: deoxyribonuclease IV [Gemmatimonadetes bacterium]|jgi:deoxyribonuclease-4|nr:deoxyribonuclease IV [Gemmatimonadota bacterium]